MSRYAELLLLLFALALHAHAYVDPATGNFLLQIIIGGVASAYVAVKMFWGRFRGRSKKEPVPPQE